MKKKFTTFIACAVSSILACTFLPACAEEEIDVEKQAIIGNWLCTDIPTEGMTSDQAAAFENYYMYLNVSAYDVLTLDADDCDVKTSYIVTYDDDEYTDVDYMKDGTYYLHAISKNVYAVECDYIEITEHIVCDGVSYYDYYPVYDANGKIESYKIYNEITDSTKEENITLRIDAYVTSEYYKDSSTTFTTLTIDKNNSKYSANGTLFLRFNAGTEESYVFEMDGDNKLTMTSSTSIYSFMFNRTETSYTSFCANYDYSSLHIRNEAVVGCWRYNTDTLKIFIEIGASDQDTLYIKSISYQSTANSGAEVIKSNATLEIDKNNSSYSITDLYLNPDYGSASDYSITVMNDGSIFIQSTVTGESFSHSFSPAYGTYDMFDAYFTELD